MKKIIRQGYVKPQYIAECDHCHTLFTFNDDDTDYANVMYTDEQYVSCPYCGTDIYDRFWNEIKDDSDKYVESCIRQYR